MMMGAGGETHIPRRAQLDSRRNRFINGGRRKRRRILITLGS